MNIYAIQAVTPQETGTFWFDSSAEFPHWEVLRKAVVQAATNVRLNFPDRFDAAAWEAVSAEVVDNRDRGTVIDYKGASFDLPVDGWSVHLMPYDREQLPEDMVDEMLNGFIDACLWADGMPAESDDEENTGETGGLEHLGLGTEDRTKLGDWLAPFLALNMDLAERYVAACEDGSRNGYSPHEGTPMSHFGHDLYLTSAHHGTGFWDRGLGTLGDDLTTEAGKAPWTGIESICMFAVKGEEHAKLDTLPSQTELSADR